ncbi:MAG: hypothetical protein LQ349_003616 [Xanthoria aureola]|nr:MAG: hypothetical protein LQ349_003616 [Xanthoria aureola]
MSDLADIIDKNTKIVTAYYSDHQIPAPSIDTSSPFTAIIHDEKVAAARFAALAAMHELKCLMLGPTEALMSVESEEILSLQAVYRYEIDQKLDVTEELSFETLSSRCGLNVIDLRRILRYAMTYFLFREPRPGFVAHTSLSKALAQDVRLRNYIGVACEERFPASAQGFALSQNTGRGLYEELRQHPERQRRWTMAMNALASNKNFDFIIDSFGWLRYSTGTVVDVGGGSGTICEGLAFRLPKLKFIVQDVPEVIEQASINPKLTDRISFMPYNFFDEQPARDAEIYYFRNIFHNWPDAQCTEILRSLIPALKPADTPSEVYRALDLRMMIYFGSCERTVDDWKQLLGAISPRFKVQDSAAASEQANVIIDVVWECFT